MFLLRPKPFLGESLSSWRQRAGIANGFRRFPCEKKRSKISDPDRYQSLRELEWLSREFALSEERLEESTLDHGLAPVVGSVKKCSQERWILPIGSCERSPLSGPVYCPLCLQDGDSYFRIAWRFAFLSHCPDHNVPLQDRCPSCNCLVWPASYCHINSSTWAGLRFCVRCAQDLARNDDKTCSNFASSVSSKLWSIYSNRRSSSNSALLCNSNEYFDGLWSICQLLLRRQSAHIRKCIPFEIMGEIPNTTVSSRIELVAAPERYRLIEAATWLLDEWPERFIESASREHISSSHFLSTRKIHPLWLSSVIETDLRKKSRNSVSESDVLKSIETLQSQNVSVTKLAVKRLLGVKENKIIDEFLDQRRTASTQELGHILDLLDGFLKVVPNAREEYRSFVRDYAIFLFSVYLGESVSKICDMSQQEVEAIFSAAENLPMHTQIEKEILLRLEKLHTIYLKEVRPFFLRGATSNSWFVSRFGKAIASNSVRSHISKIMKNEFSDDLWKSVDVFQYVLGNAPIGRRGRQRQSNKK